MHKQMQIDNSDLNAYIHYSYADYLITHAKSMDLINAKQWKVHIFTENRYGRVIGDNSELIFSCSP